MFPFLTGVLYRGARAVVNQYLNQNNADMRTNGELWLLRRILPEARVVFDVGANVGDWAAHALSINPAIDLHAFEPSLTPYQRLSSRGLNGHFNHLGLGRTCREADLYIVEPSSHLNSLYRREGLQDGYNIPPTDMTERIRLTTGDAYCREHGITAIDFCKVDVEGYELDVFQGMTELLSQQRVKVIQFEYGGCNIDSRTLLLDLFRFFQPHGYWLHRLMPSGLELVPRYDQRWENFQYQNWVALPR